MTTKKPTVVIADDSALIRFQLSDILSELGFEILGEASNGNEAVLLYKNLKPDFVTLDIVMPEKDGPQALDEIKTIDPNAKVIMITALGKQEVVKDCIKRGASDFIVKPFNPMVIKDIFNKYL